MIATVSILKPVKNSFLRLIRSFFLCFCLGFCVTSLISGCSVSSQEPQHLRIGVNDWPGYAIAHYAQSENLFKQRGLEVELVQFNNQQDNIRATMRGALDASFVPLWEVFQVDPGEDRPAFIMVTDISAGSDGIVARAGIESVTDLKGKRIGVKLGTVTHLVLLEALQAAAISPSDIEVVDVSNDIGIQELEAGSLDAAVVWEPTLSKTAQAIGGKVIFTTADVDSLVIDGLASRQSFVDQNQKTFAQFMLAWFDAIQAVEQTPDTVFEIIGQQINQDKETFAQNYAGLEKGNLAMNQRMFAVGRLTEAVQQIVQLLKADPRHGRVIRQDIEINSTPVLEAIKLWQQ